MRHNQTLIAKELQHEARKAIETAEGETQSSVSRALGITRAAVSVALRSDTPSRYAATLARIVAYLTDYEIDVERVTVYRVKRKRKRKRK